MKNGTSISGLLLLNKERGLTSFEALGPVKKAFNTGKVGHTGTLDKFADGLLAVLVGKSLKLSPWFLACDKEYIATILFGTETDTLDPEGTVIASSPLPSSIDDFEKIIPQFIGEILQAPPAYSAIHIDGKRAHELARSGKTIEMKKRPVTIFSITLEDWSPPSARIKVHCSSGTYIRSLARDIASSCGSRAHLTALTRTQIGGFTLNEAINSKEIINSIKIISPQIMEALGMSYIFIDPEDEKKAKQGKPINFKNLPPPTTEPDREKSIALFSHVTNELVAILISSGGGWRYGHVFV